MLKTTWATETEILAASNLLRTPIFIADCRSLLWNVFNPSNRGIAEVHHHEMSLYLKKKNLKFVRRNPPENSKKRRNSKQNRIDNVATTTKSSDQ